MSAREIREIVSWDDVERLIVAEQRVLLLSEIRHAVDAVASYLEQTGRRLEECVDVVCDELGIPRDADRRVIRNGVAKRLLRKVERGNA